MINETIADIRDETILLGHDKPQGGSKSGLVIFDIILKIVVIFDIYPDK